MSTDACAQLQYLKCFLAYVRQGPIACGSPFTFKSNGCLSRYHQNGVCIVKNDVGTWLILLCKSESQRSGISGRSERCRGGGEGTKLNIGISDISKCTEFCPDDLQDINERPAHMQRKLPV